MSFYDSLKIIVNVSIIIIIGIIIWWFYKERRINKLDRRLGKYSLESRKNKEFSLFDYLSDLYLKVQNKLNKILKKSKILCDYSNKYKKYINEKKDKKSDPMSYITAKFICSFILVIMVILVDTLQNTNIDFLSFIIAFLIGFFFPDLILLTRKSLVKKSLENDLLKAVTIMNNSFKSGRSIMQTIEIVKDELEEGELKKEFQQMVLDLNYGLTFEEVFKRLEERVKLDELKYISTSLSILNKTGGNIVKVFSSIEKTFFNNQKLLEELKNLTASSKFLYRVLTLVPIVFTILIYLLDPTYFNPLFKNILGYFILLIVIILYVSYIFIVKKVINIKE